MFIFSFIGVLSEEAFRYFKKVRYYQKFLEHLPYINFVPVSEFSLDNVKIKMKLVVKTNLLKYADYKKNILIKYFNNN